MPIPGAMYSSMSHVPGQLARTGFQTSAHWPLTAFALTCGASLLFRVTAANRSALGAVQGVCSLLVFAVALQWYRHAEFAPLPGVLLAVGASILMICGTLDRFKEANGQLE